jgi:photosystem II stability/assembly factor-like uncharacterized protein
MAQLPERSRSCGSFSRVCRWWLAPVIVCVATTGLAHAAGAWIPIGPNDVAMVSALSVGRNAVYAATCNGVYRSDDGGGSWREAGLQGGTVLRIAADPRSDTIYAIVLDKNLMPIFPEPSLLIGPYLDSTVWVSRDGGRSWNRTPVFHGISIAVDPTEPDTAYVSSYHDDFYPLAVTHDSGTTWTPISEAPSSSFTQVVVDPRDGAVYALAPGSTIAVRHDRAWTETPLELHAVGVGSGSDGAVYAAGYRSFCRRTTAAPNWTCGSFPGSAIDVLEIPATGPQGPTIVVVSFEGVYVSSDRGTTWSFAAGDPVGYTPAVALDPASLAVYAGNDAGVYRSVDRGITWTSSSAGLRSSWVRALAIDPADASTIWAGAEGRAWDLDQPVPGLFRSTNAGDSWTRVPEAGEPGYVFSLDVSTADPLRVYASSFFAVTHTDDGGARWSTSSPSGFVYGVASDPGSASTVWAATEGRLRKSTDGGSTWSDSLARSVYNLLFDNRHPGTIYAGSSWYEPSFYYWFGWGFAVETSRDNGGTWTRVGIENEGAAVSLAIDPFSPDVVYAGTDAATILRSDDAGATWRRWSRRGLEGPGDRVFALVADPARSGTLYMGGWNGVARSIDGGRDWDDFSEGLSPLGVYGLVVSRDGRWLYAGTTGGGVFRRDLFDGARQPVIMVDRPPRTTRTVPP